MTVVGEGPDSTRPEAVEVAVDRQACVGSQVCVAIAPQVFAIDDDGLAVVTSADRAPLEVIEQAARECPTLAIHVSLGVVSGERPILPPRSPTPLRAPE